MTRIVLTGVSLLDGEMPARRNATVVVEAGRVASISRDPPRPEPGDRLIELDGKTHVPSDPPTL
jgi:cytosine/adenosine deaminase-related metal-dependent hydrolase